MSLRRAALSELASQSVFLCGVLTVSSLCHTCYLVGILVERTFRFSVLVNQPGDPQNLDWCGRVLVVFRCFCKSFCGLLCVIFSVSVLLNNFLAWSRSFYFSLLLLLWRISSVSTGKTAEFCAFRKRCDSSLVHIKCIKVRPAKPHNLTPQLPNRLSDTWRSVTKTTRIVAAKAYHI